jgi:glucoside 3-dehydrogenase (cytochrome c) hitch-hiker subunit
MGTTSRSGVNRRDALRRLAAGGLGAAAAPFWVETLGALAREQAAHAHAASAKAVQSATPWAPKVLNRHQVETVATLSELIIPETDTPGAKAALVDRFVDAILLEAGPAERQRFVRGLAWLDSRSAALFKKDFISASPAQQTDLLTRLSAQKSVEARTGVDFFAAIKVMTITGYYSSEIGLRQELGDDGVLAQATFVGCTHPEHGG